MLLDELLPYYHPTQTVLVDDDIDFLGNLSLQLDADLAYLLFDSTEKALDYINEREAGRPSRRRFFDIGSDGAGQTDGNPPSTVRLDNTALLNEMYYTNRFSQLSVAMVDYAMPRLNGIDLCRQIKNPNIKKILFTGVATEADAVEAFNQGVIDRYIRKSEHKVYETLNRTIRELQHAHIRAMFDAAGEVFEIEHPAVLSNKDVISLMQELHARYQYVEYYLTARPSGFMLVNAEGQVHRLVLGDERWFDEQARRARQAGAPAECVDALNRREVVFNPAAIDPEAAQNDVFRHWSEHSCPTAPLAGGGAYHWALFEYPDALPARHPPIANYNRYLEWIDTLGYSLM